jgi:hypothetical protein
MNTWMTKAASKLKRLAIPNLMKYIVICMGAVFVLDLVFSGRLSDYLVFSKTAIWQGEVWRLITFVFLPLNSSIIFIVFSLYFYWLIGSALEREWGEAKFNLFYLTGIVGTIVAGLITGYATNYYLNLSLFFAFAILFPNFELLLFFILPVKVKWLAYLDAAFFVYMLVISGWPERIALLVSVANIILFFQKDARRRIANIRRKRQWKNHFR